jgi:hypothetical protein
MGSDLTVCLNSQHEFIQKLRTRLQFETLATFWIDFPESRTRGILTAVAAVSQRFVLRMEVSGVRHRIARARNGY